MIKGSNGYWIEYDDADFELNNFINSRNRTRAKVKYHPLAYFLFYIRRDPAVTGDWTSRKPGKMTPTAYDD